MNQGKHRARSRFSGEIKVLAQIGGDHGGVSENYWIFEADVKLAAPDISCSIHLHGTTNAWDTIRIAAAVDKNGIAIFLCFSAQTSDLPGRGDALQPVIIDPSIRPRLVAILFVVNDDVEFPHGFHRGRKPQCKIS